MTERVPDDLLTAIADAQLRSGTRLVFEIDPSVVTPVTEPVVPANVVVTRTPDRE